MQIRDARPQDAPALAYLMDLAGEGVPSYLWSQLAPGGDPLAFGAQRAIREQGGFSYRNAKLLELQGQVAGMLLGYPLPDPYNLAGVEDEPPLVRPLLALEALAAGSWYINAIATYAQFRGRGVASRLLTEAVSLAELCGCDRLSLIVDSANRGAGLLYAKLGFHELGRRPLQPYPGARMGREWVLMVKPLPRYGGRPLC